MRLPLVFLVEVFTERPQWWEDVHEEEWEPARDEAEHDQTWGIQNILKLVYTDKKTDESNREKNISSDPGLTTRYTIFNFLNITF